MQAGGEGARDPDGELVARIAKGDQGAVRALVDRHIGALMAVARRMLGSQHEAEEVVQDVFLRVWTNAAKWQPGQAKFATWMHRVAINLCYDRLRRRREVSVDTLPERPDPAPGAEVGLEEGDLARLMDAELQELPERQRSALVLCHYQGLSQSEAAEILDISVEALESLLSRARRRLRDRLAGVAKEYFEA
jgi:RNA polymerase sigma-70 factor (ECF subfamily)